MGICLSTYLVMLTDSLSKTGLMLEKICWTWNYSVLRVKGCCPTRTGQMPINSLRGRWKIIELQSAELQSQWWKVNTKQHSTTQPHYWKIIDFLKIFLLRKIVRIQVVTGNDTCWLITDCVAVKYFYVLPLHHLAGMGLHMCQCQNPKIFSIIELMTISNLPPGKAKDANM